jgi:ribosomal protein L37AE/L43A
MKAPTTLDEFYRTFPTERRCWEILRRVRWPDGFRCPRCEGRKAHRLRVRGLWQCASCRYQASPTAGTPFHGTRVPLRTWFLAMFYGATQAGHLGPAVPARCGPG